MASMQALVGDAVVVQQMVDDHDDRDLVGVEVEAAADAVARRRREFARGRACARRALGALGCPPVALPVGPDGAPCWPAAAVGSITHCERYVAAAVGPVSSVCAIGIDAEPHGPLPPRVLARLAAPVEHAAAEALDGVCGDRILFSAKEAAFKALAGPGAPGALDRVVVRLRPGGTFTAVVGPWSPIDGRWTVVNDLVLTAVVIPRGPRRSS